MFITYLEVVVESKLVWSPSSSSSSVQENDSNPSSTEFEAFFPQFDEILFSELLFNEELAARSVFSSSSSSDHQGGSGSAAPSSDVLQGIKGKCFLNIGVIFDPLLVGWEKGRKALSLLLLTHFLHPNASGFQNQAVSTQKPRFLCTYYNCEFVLYF